MDLMKLSLPADAGPRRVWSPQSEAIFSAVRETSDNIIVEAVAGSGKTTNLIQATNWTSSPTKYLAFARANALDLQTKLPDPKMAQTINSMGHGMWMRNVPGAQIDFDKVEKICARLLDREDQKKYGYLIRRIVGQAKAAGVGIDSPISAGSFDHFITNGDWDIDDKDVSRVAELCSRVFTTSAYETETFDFDDQVYGPVLHRWKFPRIATLLVDEAQDLNTIQHLFIEQLVAQGARLIAVGDRFQAIYAFRGALHNSLDLLQKQFNMLSLPLSVCYRCPQTVIQEAQTLVPQIQWRPGAPVGSLTYHREAIPSGEERRDPELFPENWLILCRNNAPLFSAVMRHVRARRPCRVLSNALEGLASFIKRMRASNTEDLMRKVEKWKEKEILAAEAKGMPWKAAAIEDKADTVMELSVSFHSVEEVLDLLRQLSEGKSGPMFATIHKAKGLEAPHTYLLRPDLLPGFWVEKPEDLQQEMNLKYVAVTRAQESFTYGLTLKEQR